MRAAKHHWIEVANAMDNAVVEAHVDVKRKSAQPLSDNDLLELAIDLEKAKGNATIEEARRAVYHADDVKRRLEDIRRALTDLQEVIEPETNDGPKYNSKNLAITKFTDSSFNIRFNDGSNERASGDVLGWVQQVGSIIEALGPVEKKYGRISDKSFCPDDEIMSDPLMSLDYKTVLAGSILHELYKKYYPKGKLVAADDNPPSGETIFINMALGAFEYEQLSAKTISSHRTEINKR